MDKRFIFAFVMMMCYAIFTVECKKVKKQQKASGPV